MKAFSLSDGWDQMSLTSPVLAYFRFVFHNLTNNSVGNSGN